MKKRYYFFIVVFLCLSFITYLSVRSFAQNQPIDTFTITLTDLPSTPPSQTSVLGSTNALNITLSFSGGTAQLVSGLKLTATGATLLLSDVNATTNLVTVVWTGTVTGGKAIITGMVNPSTVTGNPIITVKKAEAAGGKDITNSVISNVVTSSSVQVEPTPEPTPEPTSEPTPKPSPTPKDEEEDDEPSISISGPDTIELLEDRLNLVRLRVTGSDFTSVSRCKVTVSDEDLVRVKPKRFSLTRARNKKSLIVRVPTSIALELIEDESSEFVILSVSCTNGAEDEVEILLEPSFEE